ncbi:MAG: hydantoinase/oxoprolinase family protein [Gammaproteobacteria bacterium]|nr:hydantoinase/oxoprolinase family protein [Gammaproteobacteria bacterium]
MTKMISGWDIGGAHVKVARCDQHGQLIQLIQVACPLWQGIEQLEQAIESIFAQLNNKDDVAAITMTGELVDIFSDRQAGVEGILTCLARYLHTDNTHVYAAELGWLSPDNAKENWQYVASRNWQASASHVAQHIPNGIFVDIGSTTSDIIPLLDGQAVPQKSDDFGRQTSRELLYTGAIRTPLIAISQTAPFNGISVSLAAELFATTGDVWCLLGELNPNSIQDTSADNQPWEVNACACRIARLLGTDANQAELKQWLQLAQWFAEQQSHLITDAILHVISAHSKLPVDAPLIGAGVGRFIVKFCAQRLNRPYLDFHTVIDSLTLEASDHAPAVAVALLAKHKLP